MLNRSTVFESCRRPVKAGLILSVILTGMTGCTSSRTAEHVSSSSAYVWVKKPGTLDIDDFEDLALIYPGNGYGSYAEQTGYSPTWMEVNATDLTGGAYTGNAIIGIRDQKKGIYNYDGKVICKPQYDRIESDYILGVYGCDNTDDGSTLQYFDQNFHPHQTEVNGIGGEISGDLAVYSDGMVYDAYDETAVNYHDYSRETPVIVPVKDHFSLEEERDLFIASKPLSSPDGYVILQKGKEPVSLPEKMTPVYEPEVLEKEIPDEKTEQYHTAFVNGVIKLLDQNNGMHLWNARSQKFLSDETFQDAAFYEDGYIGVKKNNRWAFLNEKGQTVTAYQFDKVSGLYQGKAYVTYHGKTGILDVKKTVETGKENTTQQIETGFQTILTG